ncbi:MAG TPA: hypothetical protein VG778_12140, partial [Blastocatellia bacterium]|nr:hypothetical protein [Blastocatellia bacterium]
MSKQDVLGADSVDVRTTLRPLACTYAGVKREGAFVVLAIGFVVAVGYDAFHEIPPIADDLWMIEFKPGQIFLTYGAEHGWVGRVLGQIVIDTVNSIARVFGGDLRVPLILVRSLSLALVFGCLNRQFAQSIPISLAAMVLFGLTPAAGETWAMLCTSNLTLAAPAALFACAFFWRSALRAIAGKLDWKLIGYALLMQTVANALYEQAVLAVPSFSVVLILLLSLKDRLSWERGVVIASASVAASLIWLASLFVSGYVASRSTASAGFEASDVTGGLNALWIAFGEHNLWRAVELIRAGRLGWWDSSAAGALGMISAIALAILIGFLVASLKRGDSDRSSSDQADNRVPNTPVIIAAACAALAAVLPAGFAVDGFIMYSRMFYLPGLFIALSIALILRS